MNYIHTGCVGVILKNGSIIKYSGVTITTIDKMFWSIKTFTDLSNTSGIIKIWDNSSVSNVIDVVEYDMDADFLLGGGVPGRAAVFIIDPTLFQK